MNNERAIHPQLPVWKLALLLLATATLYQFVWLYRLAWQLRTSRNTAITPWHWLAAPLLGPLMAVPAHHLASYLKQQQVEEQAEVGHLAEPVFVSMMVIVAYLPLFMLIFDTTIAPSIVVITALLLCLPYLALQGQLNLNLRRTESWIPKAFGPRHLFGMAASALLAVPLYVYTLTDIWERRGSTDLVVGNVVEPEDGFFLVRVGDDDWTQVNPGTLAADSALEFFGPDDTTWAIVYDSTGVSVDDVMSYRVQGITEEYRSALCEQQKSLLPQSLTVLGTVECTGRNALLGSYTFVARTIKDASNVVEIVAFTSQSDANRYAEFRSRIKSFADGLEIVR